MRTWILLFCCFVGTNEVYAECRAVHPFSNAQLEVREYSGETFDAYALASWLPYGPPTIYYGKRFESLTELQKKFVQKHECAHLSVPTVDEVLANCAVLRQLRDEGLNQSDEAEIARWIVAEGAQGFLVKGDPRAFWNATIECADAP